MAISYLHPYIETNIYDNSEVYESSVGNNTVLFQPYFSERGISDKIEEFSDLTTFLKAKGYPNFRKYGQSMYNIVNWLKSGGKVVGIRLTASNSTFANVGLNVKTKAIEERVEATDADGNILYEEDGVTPQYIINKSVDIKLETISFEGLEVEDTDSLQILMDNRSMTEDEEGYKDHIIFVVSCKGKGTYGNNISIRISSNKAASKTYDNFKVYNLTVVQTKDNGSVRTSEGPLAISLYPDAVSLGGSSLSMQQIITDYFGEISCFFNEDAYDNLIDYIMEATDNAYDSTGNIDFIFGDDYITVDNTDATDLFSYTGAYFENGSDGDLFVPKTTSQSVMDQLLINTFNGTLNAEIFDKRRFPIDVVLDFNTSSTVKIAINDFVNQRGDCICLLDTGEQASSTVTVNWKRSNLVVDDYLTSIWSQMLTIYDQYTAQDMFVTPTYFLASKIPANDSSYGMQYPFVGPNRGIITGFKSLNWSPNEDQKENLYDNRINYIEQNYRTTRFMSQLTSQTKTTSLSDINHVRCLLRIVRSVEELMENYLFELATDDTISRINAALETLLSPWVSNGTCTQCNGICSQTQIEKEQKIAHVTVEIVFVDVIERILIDVNVTR